MRYETETMRDRRTETVGPRDRTRTRAARAETVARRRARKLKRSPFNV